ncbi:MAG TPA: serine/threonine-protein kinase [Aldersonia sp.]
MHANARRGEHGRSAPGADPVAEFALAWAQAQSPPDLAQFLPTDDHDGVLDLVRIDLQQRWLRAGLGKRISDYCAELPGIELDAVPADLVYEEFVIRRQAGERVDPRDYLREHPAQAGELAELLALDEGTSTRWLGEQTVAPDRAVAVDGTRATDLTRTAAAGLDPTVTRTSLARPPQRDTLDEVAVGDQIDDFDLLTGLGAGAFARVFLARQRSMQRLVAVKISADHGSEPQTLARLDHDYIVRIFDQRVLPEQQLKLLYMQFLPGGTLLGVLRWVRATPVERRNGQLLLDAVDAAMEEKGEIRPSDSSVREEIAGLSWPETVAWLGRRLAEALDYADARGVLHRDVKPANVLLTAEGVPKLADFNISYSRNTAGTSPVAYFGGSLSYMSPEQLEACHPHRLGTAADLDTRADIFSLGVVLWELLTGAKPFDDAGAGGGGDDTQIDAMLHTRRDGLGEAALGQLPEDCPAALRRVLLTCLAADPGTRFATGGELAQQLDLCLDAHARDLVDPAPNSWRLRLRPSILPLVALAVAIPMALAAAYNIHHNQTLIISKLSTEAQRQFETITAIINLTFFPLGTALIIYLCRYVLTVPRGLRHGRTYDAETLARARNDTLLVADRVVAVGFGFWALAGIAFPVTLQLVAGDVPASAYVHFVASLLVCGAIAVSYPFFLIAFYMVRSIYPMFLQHGEPSADDAHNMRGLDRRSNFYLAVAASVPLLGVAGVTFISPDEIPQVIFAVRVLCVGGILAFLLAYRLFRLLEEDLRALERVVRAGPARG